MESQEIIKHYTNEYGNYYNARQEEVLAQTEFEKLLIDDLHAGNILPAYAFYIAVRLAMDLQNNVDYQNGRAYYEVHPMQHEEKETFTQVLDSVRYWFNDLLQKQSENTAINEKFLSGFGALQQKALTDSFFLDLDGEKVEFVEVGYFE